MNGYILLERSDSEESAGGECGLLIDATYPILGAPDEPEPEPEFDFDVVVREPGFESSAKAKDCGGGTSEVVFDTGEPPRVLHFRCLGRVAAGYVLIASCC